MTGKSWTRKGASGKSGSAGKWFGVPMGLISETYSVSGRGGGEKREGEEM